MLLFFVLLARQKQKHPDHLVGVLRYRNDKLVVQVIGVLYIDGVCHSVALCDRRLREILTTTKLLQNARTLILTLELFQGALDVFALLYRGDNHSCILFCVLILVCSLLFATSFQAGRPLSARSISEIVGSRLLCIVQAVSTKYQVGTQPFGLLLGQYVLFNHFSGAAPTSFQCSMFNQSP